MCNKVFGVVDVIFANSDAVSVTVLHEAWDGLDAVHAEDFARLRVFGGRHSETGDVDLSITGGLAVKLSFDRVVSVSRVLVH